jgi:hypothetical protein
MFGLDFLFASALWALPLAGLPVLLHLLFRRKSPLVEFSTLRFIKTSLQHTAARKKVQRWLLLACRALLLALLIWAIAQPARRLASSWFGASAGGQSLVAAIVVDSSYSMQVQDQQVSTLQKANGIVEDLLRGQLKDASVALFAGGAKAEAEQVQSASALLSQWTPLTPHAAAAPLVDRIASATALLNRQGSAHKWLIVLSDLQGKEFPRPLPPWNDGRIILFDLHPVDARDAGLTQLTVVPEQPIPGIKSEAAVEAVGHTGEVRAVTLGVQSLAGKDLGQSPPTMARFDGTGRALLRIPLNLPADQRWLLLSASVQAEDAMAWDNTRSRVLEVPPRQAVTLLKAATPTEAERFLKLVLDPSEGKNPAWPVTVREAEHLSGKEQVAVVPLTAWPDEQEARRLVQLASGGGTVILAVRPGLEATWGKLSEAQRKMLLQLLPSAPAAETGDDAAYRVALASANDPVMKQLNGKEFNWGTMVVRRLVPMSAGDAGVTTLLSVSPVTPRAGERPRGLLYRKAVGGGLVYTLATLPTIELATPPPFLPLMVSLCLRPLEQSAAQNVELGQPLTLSGQQFNDIDSLEVQGPGQELFEIKPTTDQQGRHFVFDHAAAPGLYTWRRPGEPAIVAVSNVRLPADEARLTYRDADKVLTPGPNVLVATSLADLQAKMTHVSEPDPRWLGPMSIVLFLLCLEALMGSLSQLWKPVRPAWWVKLTGARPA